MEDEILDIQERIRRYHRLASVTTDDKIRVALERLAREDEERLSRRRGRPGPFMLDPERRD